MTPENSSSGVVYVHRLGRHHFAHLRSTAEGIALQDSAKRYLGVEHGHAAKNAHKQVVDRVRALARRQASSAWRLIGLQIRFEEDAQQPGIEDFMAKQGLEEACR